MRIVSGIYGGRKLNVPKGRDVRPTSDKVRGAIFNALNSRINIEGAYVLDVFCGTGALGLEALSRGAAYCTFIDKARSSIDLAAQNAADFRVVDATFIVKDVAKIPVKEEDIKAANLIFLDPPYEQGLVNPALEALSAAGWVADGAMIVIEAEKGFSAALPIGFKIDDERLYKDTKIIYASYQ